MEIQLMMASPAVDFNYDSTNTTPYVTAPCTPQGFPNFFYSAPTSPLIHSTTVTGLEEDDQTDTDDFAFFFNGKLEPPSISAADELFHCGKIKPLKSVCYDPPQSPSRFREAFSLRCKTKEFDTFTEALNQTPCDQAQSKRGSERTTPTTAGDKAKVLPPSSSPFRISDILSDEANNKKNSPTWYNKWNLKNLLRFRSTSEGIGSGSTKRKKDPVINKYSRIRKCDENVKNSSFRSTESCSSTDVSSRRVMRKVSAHEIHYTANRAVAEEMKKKTYLPYKSGLLGCLGFHNNGSGSVCEISRGINSVLKHSGG